MLVDGKPIDKESFLAKIQGDCSYVIRFDTTPGEVDRRHAEIPRCFVCDAETYALPCKECGVRICTDCKGPLTYCACHELPDEQVSPPRRAGYKAPKMEAPSMLQITNEPDTLMSKR